MQFEATTLSSVARLIGDSLEGDYGINPEPIFQDVGIDTSKFLKPGARSPYVKMEALWNRAAAASKDPWFGFAVGKRATPGDFFVFGHAWLASDSLHGALHRLCRYGQIISNVRVWPSLSREGANYALHFPEPVGVNRPNKHALDAGFVSILSLFDTVTPVNIRPVHMSLTIGSENASEHYTELFKCPISYGCEEEVWLFTAEDIDRPLPGSIPDITDATDRIARNYIETLETSKVAAEVSRMLVQMLPSGSVDQSAIASRLHRSKSTLQRQLSAEDTSYRDILESTRRSLAKRYLEEGEHTQAQIAFMTGFSDQSNFARAFKRWMGVSPGKFRSSLA